MQGRHYYFKEIPNDNTNIFTQWQQNGQFTERGWFVWKSTVNGLLRFLCCVMDESPKSIDAKSSAKQR